MEKKLKIRLPVQEEVVGEKIRLTQVQPNKTNLAEKLEAFDPVRHGGESMACEPTGKEILGN